MGKGWYALEDPEGEGGVTKVSLVSQCRTLWSR